MISDEQFVSWHCKWKYCGYV